MNITQAYAVAAAGVFLVLIVHQGFSVHPARSPITRHYRKCHGRIRGPVTHALTEYIFLSPS